MISFMDWMKSAFSQCKSISLQILNGSSRSIFWKLRFLTCIAQSFVSDHIQQIHTMKSVASLIWLLLLCWRPTRDNVDIVTLFCFQDRTISRYSWIPRSTRTWSSDVLSRVERNGSSAAQHDHKRSCLVSGYVSDAAVVNSLLWLHSKVDSRKRPECGSSGYFMGVPLASANHYQKYPEPNRHDDWKGTRWLNFHLRKRLDCCFHDCDLFIFNTY